MVVEGSHSFVDSGRKGGEGKSDGADTCQKNGGLCGLWEKRERGVGRETGWTLVRRTEEK